MNFSCLSLKSQTRTSACHWQRPLPAPCCKATQQISPSVNLSLHRGADVWDDLSERSRAAHTSTHTQLMTPLCRLNLSNNHTGSSRELGSRWFRSAEALTHPSALKGAGLEERIGNCLQLVQFISRWGRCAVYQTHVCNQLQEIEDWHLIWITGEDRRKPAMVPYLRCFDLKTYKGVKITELKKPWRQAEPFICSIRTLQRALLLRFIGCLFLQGRWSDCNPVHSIHHPLSDSFSPLQ